MEGKLYEVKCNNDSLIITHDRKRANIALTDLLKLEKKGTISDILNGIKKCVDRNEWNIKENAHKNDILLILSPTGTFEGNEMEFLIPKLSFRPLDDNFHKDNYTIVKQDDKFIIKD